MPANLPSSFASAAAGQNANARGGRGDSRGGGGDWSRREGRPNGTLTFRRSSTTPGQAAQAINAPADHILTQTSLESSVSSAQVLSDEELPPQTTSYAKQSILDLFRDHTQQPDASNVLEPGWVPGHVNGNASRGWGKSGHTHANQDPNSCWVSSGTSGPLGSRNLTAEEKDALASDVNSPLKPPNQKEANVQAGGGPVNGRKASLSHVASSPFSLASPTSASRPGTRRRETIESNPFASGGLSSPAGPSRFPREENSFFSRSSKATEPKETETSEEEGGGASTRETPTHSRPGFSGLTRLNTGGSNIGGSNISSLWGQSVSAHPASTQPSSAIGSFGQFALPTPTTAIGAPGRGGSRFANLIPKDSSDNAAAKSNEAATGAGGSGQNPDLSRSWRSRPRTDTDPFGDDNLSGSAALGGAKDTSPPPMPNPSSTFETPVKGSTSDFGMSGLNLGQRGDHDGPISPSETNPYRSPPADRNDEQHGDDSGEKHHGGGVTSEQPQNFNTLPRGFPTHGHNAFDGSDRSQTSSAGPKGYPSLSNLSGWPAPAPTGTPDRERQGFASAFGSSLFSPMGGDIQSPGGLSAIGGGGVFAPPSAGGLGTGSMGRSKLGSLFPAAMQAQMLGHEQQQQHENLSDSLPDLRQSNNPIAPIGRNTFTPQRDTDSPMRTGRGVFEELFPSSGENRGHNVFVAPGHDTHHSNTPGSQGPPFPGPSTSADLPPSQVRQMVMPDRMRWVYLDPQGQVQGPFTGLEMNDWYKANFFTADLRVKKVEDPEFEPLGQLIRRIGNSREPFLVPQIGIPHGPPSQAGPFSPATPGGVVPPLSGLFPSYGRTLTAEEQNNLERRKQEEQFAMAQQREIMMRQQALSRIQPGGLQTSLHHHSSAHSLQSQPSFGSISSPIGAPHQQPPVSSTMGPGAAFFDAPTAQQQAQQQQQAGSRAPLGGAAGLDSFRDDDLSNLNATERQILASAGGNGSFFPPQPIGAQGNEGPLRSNLPGTEHLAQDEEGFRERLQEFEGLRAEHDAEQAAKANAAQQSIEEDDVEDASAQLQAALEYDEAHGQAFEGDETAPHLLSLTQQVQQAQAAAAAAAAAKNVAAGLPMPFPPPLPQSGTPLPAPTAQRVRSNLPEQYSRSQSGTPDTSSATEPPPLAPWARETGPGGRKGPSLKEIQETEARNAAKAEEVAAAARRAHLEQETAALREREKAAAVASGLPTTSTWGNASPVPTGSPWTKPSTVKVTPGVSGAAKQKTLADIQREEEARKEKAAKALQAQTGFAPTPGGPGKRYADLATRPGGGANPPGFPQLQGNAPAVTGPPPGSGWATVGAGGKVKGSMAPGPAAAAAPTPTRSVSTSSSVKPVTVAKAVSKPPSAGSGPGAKSDAAMDEFNKWLHRELSRGITGIDIEGFAATLLILPQDTTLIADAVYANSKTMNGQHFAEEFVRRKKRADQGIVEKQPAAPIADVKAGGAPGGWNEVAKKSGNREATPANSETGPIQGAGFKVVPGRKKGNKKN